MYEKYRKYILWLLYFNLAFLILCFGVLTNQRQELLGSIGLIILLISIA